MSVRLDTQANTPERFRANFQKIDGVLAGLSATGHLHSIADVANLQTTLDGKAASSHTHTIANVTNLQTTLDGKSSTSHTHTTLGGVTFDDAANLVFSTTTGTQIGTAATQKLALWGKTPVVQPAHANQAAISAATAAALTDSTGGTPGTTLAAATNIDTLTDSTGGTADDTVSDVSTAVTGVDGTGSNAASKADVDTRLGAINGNFKELVDQLITQKALNAVLINAVASLAAQINALINDDGDVRTKYNQVRGDLVTTGVIKGTA